MTEQALHKLYELKGKLDARSTILASNLTSLKALKDEIESQFYKGHTRGGIEVMSAWATDVARLQADIDQIIKEAENV